MARSKGCFASSVCCSDDFSDMPVGAQALYYRLGFEADNDGIVSNMKTIMRAILAKDDDLRVLVLKGYLIPIDGRFVIADWWINNNLDKLNYRSGNNQDIVDKLGYVNEKNRRYCLLDDQQTDISLTSVSNISKENINQYKSNEVNPTEEKAEKAIAVVSRPDGNMSFAPCPECGHQCLLSINPPYHGECPVHGMFDL